LDVLQLFDGAKKPPVKVTIKNHTYRSTIAVYGGRYYLPINRDVKKATGVQAGDDISVVIQRDEEPRLVQVPADLARAFKADPTAAKRFKALSYSHQKEYVDWVEDAKRDETRRRRIAEAVERITAGKTQR
jgi:Bacteriocin-protection, YdeI or OmpD-Associated/Domain of unknown function (DUF1905)